MVAMGLSIVVFWHHRRHTRSYAVNWCVSQWNGRDTMDVIFFFYITSGRINTWKGVNQLRELFFFNSIFIFNVCIWNWQIIGILWLKSHYFSQLITKMFFCCKFLSLNDLTLSPISRPGTHCLQWQRANARANLWWRHEPFPGETSIVLRPCAGNGGGRKKVLVMLGYHSIQQMSI